MPTHVMQPTFFLILLGLAFILFVSFQFGRGLWRIWRAGKRNGEIILKPSDQRLLGQLRFLLDKIPFPVWVRDEHLRIVYCNIAYGQALDKVPSEVVANQIELAEGALGDDGRSLIHHVQSVGLPQANTTHTVFAGKRRLVEFTEAPVTGASGFAGFAIDHTAAEDLQNELERYVSAQQETLEYLATAIAIYGTDKRLQFYNAAFVKLWKLDEEWLSTEPAFTDVLEMLRDRRRLPEYADFPAFRKKQEDLFRTLIEPREEMLHLPDERTVKTIMIPHPLGGLMFFYEDVTDRIALERSFKTLDAVQRATLDNLYEAVIVFGSEGRVKLSNPALARMWNLRPERLTAGELHIGDLLEDMRPRLAGQVDDAAWERLKHRILGRLNERRIRSGRLRRPDKRIVDYTLLPLPDGATLVTFVDITDRRNVEHALTERNRALAKADRIKSEFLAHISYELRTPLTSIIGFVEGLSGGHFGTISEPQKEYLGFIMRSASQLRLLIDDLINLASMEAGYLVLHPSEVEIKSALTAQASFFEEHLREKKMRLGINCPPSVGRVKLDEHCLKQVLSNLLSNAIKYTPAGGRIAMLARRENGWLRIAVSDTGIGIPKGDQKRVFRKFERARGSARVSGTGLGLAMVKQYVELHGGRVQLESKLGEGTTVTCWFPLEMVATLEQRATGT